MLEYLIPLGILVILVGFGMVFAGSLLSANKQSSSGTDTNSKVHVGVGGFIGPIPFGFATNKTLLYVIIGISVFIFVLWFLLQYSK